MLACVGILLTALFPPRLGFGVYYDRNSSLRAASGERFNVGRTFLFADSYRLSMRSLVLPGGGERVFHDYAQIDAGRLLGEIAVVAALAGIGMLLLGDGRPKTKPNNKGADQPATAVDSKADGKKKAKLESEGRSQ